jgi:hypothetical protein
MNKRRVHCPRSTQTYKYSDPVNDKDAWPCLGAISIDKTRLLVLWKSTWLLHNEYLSLRADKHQGWLEYALPGNEVLISWEPTIESKTIQFHPEALLVEFLIEERRGRPGLLGYVAAKYLDPPSSTSSGGKRLAFLAYWKISPMSKGLFLHLQRTFPSHRGQIIHSEKERVWVQWKPTWVYHEDIDSKRKDSLMSLRADPEALLSRFHTAMVYYSTAVATKKRL